MGAKTTPLQAHEMPYNGERITYFSAGRSAGITLVLVHGIGVSTRYYHPLITALADEFRIISVDLPGFGESSRPEKAWSIPDFGDAVEAVISHERIMLPILIGQSMGCQVVASMLARYPSLSPKAILIGPTVESKKRNVLAQAGRWLQDIVLEPPLVNFRIGREYLRCGPRQYLKTLKLMLKDRIEDNLAASEAPVLIIRGEHDPIVPRAWASKLAAVTTAAGRCDIKDAPHLVHITNTEEVAAICEKFAQI